MATTFAIWVNPAYIGISLFSIGELAICFLTVYLTWILPLQLGQILELFKNNEFEYSIIKNAWLDAKKSFLENNKANCNKDVLSYQDLKLQKQESLANLAKAKKEKSKDLIKAYCDIGNLFERVDNSYMNELSLLVHFLVLIIVGGNNYLVCYFLIFF